MDPEYWGPKGWYFIHSVALAYPEAPTSVHKENYKLFFKNLGNVLPCPICQEHYRINYIEAELDNALESRILLFNWTVDLHNKVNIEKDKPTYTYKEALDALHNGYDNTNYNVYIYIFLIIIIIYLLKNK